MGTGSKNQLASIADQPVLEMLSGKEKGGLIELTRGRLTIGRSEDNDVVLQAEGVSRQHALLIQSDGSWFIRDNQSRNGVIVNGKPVAECWLKTGDVIQLGNFVARFNAGTGELRSEAPLVASAGNGIAGMGGETAKPKRKINKRVLIYGVGALVVIGALMMGTGETEKKKEPVAGGEAAQTDPAAGGKLARDFKVAEEPKIEGEKQPNAAKGIEDPVLKRAEQEMAKLDWTNSSLKQSEQFFRRGQREYLDHNYHRAIEYFQTSLSLYRGHLLADQYLRRAVYEVEVEAKKHMEFGIQYFESLQYQRAIYHFSEVVALMAHRPTEPIVGEADRYIQQAKRRLQAAELFP